jgi:hypothetical protein
MSESLNEPRKEDAMLHQMLLKREIPAGKNEYFRRFSSFRLRLLQFEKTTHKSFVAKNDAQMLFTN